MSKIKKTIGYWSALSIGIGGMVGGGIFAVLGLAVQFSKGGAPIAFILAGIIALVTSYSYTRLSLRFPSRGGTVEFLYKAFGPGILTGSLNILLWLSYIVMLSLYAYAFGSYAASFFPQAAQLLWRHILISMIIVLFTILNFMGSRAVGRSEIYIVVLKIIILFIFIGAGLFSMNYKQIQPQTWSNPVQLIAGGMIIFLAYEGFELIANTAENIKNPRRNLPLAYYSSVGFVIILYFLVSLVTVGNLAIDKIIGSKDYALAEAAKPFLGNAGFILITIAALLSTSSAINATLYGSARISYTIAKDGELPVELEKKIWNRPLEGLLITSGITLLVANLFDLTSISTMGSSGFLLIFAAVNISNAKLSSDTVSKKWISITGAVICFTALIILLVQQTINDPRQLIVFASMVGLSFIIEFVYRRLTRRTIKSSKRT